MTLISQGGFNPLFLLSKALNPQKRGLPPFFIKQRINSEITEKEIRDQVFIALISRIPQRLKNFIPQRSAKLIRKAGNSV
jgi:hypothetical protein